MKGCISLNIYTHLHLDLDAASAVSLFLLANPKYKIQNVRFVSAEFSKPLGPTDVALDIHANGQGIKGFKTSAFSEVLKIIDKKYRPCFQNLADFVDAHDSTGNWKGVYGLPKNFNLPNILDFFRAYQRAHPGRDADMLRVWYAYIKGLWLSYQDFQKAKKVIKDKNKVRWIKAEHTVLVKGKVPQQVFSLLFDHGARFVIYDRENTMGVMRSPKEKTHIGDNIKWLLPEWFHHPSGFLSCWGTVKCPKDKPCGEDPEYIAEIVSNIS